MSIKLIRMTDLDLSGKRVLIREDLNVPIQDGAITSDARIRAALPTVRTVLQQGAKVMVLSHLGRPKEGGYQAQFSLAAVAAKLSELLGVAVPLCRDWLGGVECAAGAAVLCENVRFNTGEKKDDEALSRRLGALCDVFVMDAFATAHRAEASTHGVARFAPIACAGPLLLAELEALERALASPARPLVAVVGGSKVSSKLPILEALLDKVDQLIVGGGLANTLLAATGVKVGKSLCEIDMFERSLRLLIRARERGVQIVLPTDAIVAREPVSAGHGEQRRVAEVGAEELIVDIGALSAKEFGRLLRAAGTIIWNGPMGVFEVDQFGGGTKAIAEAIAESKAFSLAGGGETLAAIEKYGVGARISYISTGGGAFLECVEGKSLPAVAVLEERARGATAAA